MLWALAASIDQYISLADLQVLVHGDNEGDRSNALIQLVKNVRQDIEADTA